VLLTVAGDLNITEDIENIAAQAANDLVNITDEAFHDPPAVIKDIFNEDWAALNVSLNLDNIVPLPNTLLQFTFDNMELYAELDLNLTTESTYKVNLFTSETMYGISGDGMELGVLFKVDFIVTADTEVDISGGFHIKLNDGLAFDIALFGNNISSVTL
jgi:hypothetical protein